MRKQILKRLKGAVVLTAALGLLLTGCGRSADDGAQGTADEESSTEAHPSKKKQHEDKTKDGETEQSADLPDSLLTPGRLPYPVEGGFASGRVVVFDTVSYLAEPDGIYRVDEKSVSCERIAEDDLPESAQLCTDGFTLYYADLDGRVFALDLTDGDRKTEILKESGVPFGSSVVGAGYDRLYVQTMESYDDSGDYMDDLGSVQVYALSDGTLTAEYPTCAGGAAEGYVYVLELGYDFSTRPLTVFSFDGKALVSEERAYGVWSSGGKLWYGIDPDEDMESIVVCTLSGDEVAEFGRYDMPGNMIYGFRVGGFLMDIAAMDYAVGDYPESYYDLRTGGILSHDMLSIGGAEYLFWTDGVTLSDTDFYLSGSQLATDGPDGLTVVYEVPSGMYADLYLTEGCLIVDNYDGGFSLIPMDTQTVLAGTHAISVTSEECDFDVWEDGLDVAVSYTQFGERGSVSWQHLIDALEEYNAEVKALAHERAEAAAELSGDAETLEVLNGDNRIRADVKAYIKRADTTAFCFVQHQSAQIGAYYPEDIRTGYNYDTKDGHALKLTEVVRDFDALSELFTEHLMDVNGLERADAAEYVEEYLSLKAKPSSPETSWVLGYEGVTFFYNGDVNFPYAMQCGTFYLSFAEHKEVFTELCFDRPASYAYDVMLAPYYTEELVLSTPSGDKAVLLYTEQEDEDSPFAIDTLNYCIYDNRPDAWMDLRSEPVYSDTLSAMILHTADDQNYLLLQYDGDSAGILLYALDEKAGKLTEAGEITQGVLPQYMGDREDDSYYDFFLMRTWLSQPELFAVQTLDEENWENGYSVTRYFQLMDGELRAEP